MCTSPSASFSSTRSTNQGASIPSICRYSSRSCIPTFWHPHIVTHYKVGIPQKEGVAATKSASPAGRSFSVPQTQLCARGLTEAETVVTSDYTQNRVLKRRDCEPCRIDDYSFTHRLLHPPRYHSQYRRHGLSH